MTGSIDGQTNRRRLLKTVAGSALLSPCLFSGGLALADGDTACAPSKEAATGAPLKARAGERGLLFGTAADRDPLELDQSYAEVVAAECAMVTPENSMKWERLRPTPETFSFENSDWLVDFAEANGLAVHGHTLTWHSQLPGWFEDVVEKANAEQMLRAHIETVAGRYANRIRSWDVVNEAIEDEDGRTDGLRLTPWLRHLGTGYIDLAFRMAAEAAPDAMLVYNDYGLEYPDDYFENRRAYYLDLVSALVAGGAPIHAVGIQSHLDGNRRPNFERFSKFLDDIASLGLEIMITELDVRDQNLPADPLTRDCYVADTYRSFLDVVLDKPKVRSVAVWGLSDRYSWLGYFAPRDDGEPVRPLPFDREMRRKPAWSAIAEALST